MNLAIAPLTDVSSWARGNGFEAVLLVLGAVLGGRFITWLGHRIEGRIDEGSDALVRSETAKHRHAVTQVLTYVAMLVLWTVTGVLVLSRLGVPVTGLAAPAAALGVALGFGAQRFVADILSGFFVVAEKQYGYGDVIRLSLGSGIAPVTGTVEDVTLRVTQIRTADGEVVITPNGQIMQVTNLSRDWARAVIDVPVPAGVDVNSVSDELVRIGNEAYEDSRLHDLMLDPPSVMGVESLKRDELNIRLVARTLPGKQFEVGRQLRRRIAVGLRDQGLNLSPHLDTAVPSGQGS
ncbi:MAG: MscS Mechanosensitive ion channel [Frankiales bacterium]|nr:MscS Mechanosensitive ion channel [Frankiales bacterium]